MKALSLSLLVLVQSIRCRNGLRMFSQQVLQRTSRNRAHSLSDLPLPEPSMPMPVPPEWTSSVVVRNVQHARGLRSIDIEVQHEIAALYRQPGQYMRMKIKTKEAKPALLSIASPPDQRKVLSFLVKECAHHDFLVNTKAGDVLDLSAPTGSGFRIKQYIDNYKSDFPVNNVLMIACGSGLAPIAAAIESNALGLGLGQAGYRSKYARKAQLYVGARSPAHLPYVDQYARWQEMGIQVTPRAKNLYLQCGCVVSQNHIMYCLLLLQCID